MDWVISCVTLASMELIARKRWQGWALGLCNQGLWFYVVIWQRDLWGLAIIPIVLTWRYSVALRKWKAEGTR